MKKSFRVFVLGLVLASMSSLAMAGPHHGQHHNRHGGGRHGAGDWIGALVVLGLAGAVIQATTSTPVLSAPPVTYANPVNPSFPPPAPAEAHYFCPSVRQFYPDTRYCPEGWQLLTPAR